MTDPKRQNDDPKAGLSPAVIGLALGSAAAAWLALELLSRVFR